MWVSLADSRFLEIYKSGHFPDKVPQDFFLFLQQLSKKPYAERLSAATSIGQLYLTTAQSWEDREENHYVRIDPRNIAGKTFITMSYHTNSFYKSVSKHQRALNDAIDYIDLYVMRLLLVKYGEL